MANRLPFAHGEWYHCYTKGANSLVTFKDRYDYLRFQQLLYLCNSDTIIHRSDILSTDLGSTYAHERGAPLVQIASYAIMPNHYHLLLCEIVDDGISTFMRRLGVAYAMYFNKKYEHIGNVFIKPFRSKHIMTDRYLRKVVGYIHINPFELFAPKMKEGYVRALAPALKKLSAYPFSSLPDYESKGCRSEATILATDVRRLIHDIKRPTNETVQEALEYYQTLKW